MAVSIAQCLNTTLCSQGSLTDAYHFSHLLPVCARLFHTMPVKSHQLPLLNFAAQDHFEATVPASFSIALLHLFLGISPLCCPWRFQLKNCFVLAEESFFNIRQTHFHFYSLICTATGFSRTYHVPTLITKQWMVFKFTCTKLSYYSVHMRCCTKCKHKKLSSKHKFPFLTTGNNQHQEEKPRNTKVRPCCLHLV